MSARSPWRARARTLGVLGAVIVVNAAILLAYRGVYDARLRALEADKKELDEKRASLRASISSLEETDRRLETLRSGLEDFYGRKLGTRRERLAPLIEEIHLITQKAALRPDSINYVDEEVAGTDSIKLTFSVTARYSEVKRLLATFESSARFLVLETVSIGVDEGEADILHIGLSLAHYFRDPTMRSLRRRGIERASRAEKGKGEAAEKAAEPVPPKAVAAPERASVRAAAPALLAVDGEAPAPSKQGGGLLLPRVGTAPSAAARPPGKKRGQGDPPGLQVREAQRAPESR